MKSKAKPKRVDEVAYAVVAKTGRVRDCFKWLKNAKSYECPEAGDRIARCRLQELPKKKSAKK